MRKLLLALAVSAVASTASAATVVYHYAFTVAFTGDLFQKRTANNELVEATPAELGVAGPLTHLVGQSLAGAFRFEAEHDAGGLDIHTVTCNVGPLECGGGGADALEAFDAATKAIRADLSAEPFNDTERWFFALAAGGGTLTFWDAFHNSGNPDFDADADFVDYYANFAVTEYEALETPPPAPIPLPAGAVLLVSGVLGLAALRRRKNNNL